MPGRPDLFTSTSRVPDPRPPPASWFIPADILAFSIRTICWHTVSYAYATMRKHREMAWPQCMVIFNMRMLTVSGRSWLSALEDVPALAFNVSSENNQFRVEFQRAPGNVCIPSVTPNCRRSQGHCQRHSSLPWRLPVENGNHQFFA